MSFLTQFVILILLSIFFATVILVAYSSFGKLSQDLLDPFEKEQD